MYHYVYNTWFVLQTGRTGLILATQRGHFNIVNMLLDLHANPNISEQVMSIEVYV